MAETGYKIWVNREETGSTQYSRIGDANILVGNNPDVGKFTSGRTNGSNWSYVYFPTWADVLHAIGEEGGEPGVVTLRYTGSNLGPASGRTNSFTITVERARVTGYTINNGGSVVNSGATSLEISYPANNGNSTKTYRVCANGVDDNGDAVSSCINITQDANSYDFAISVASGYESIAWNATNVVFNTQARNIRNIGFCASRSQNVITSSTFTPDSLNGRVTATTQTNETSGNKNIKVVYSGLTPSNETEYVTGTSIQNYNPDLDRAYLTITYTGGNVSSSSGSTSDFNIDKRNVTVTGYTVDHGATVTSSGQASVTIKYPANQTSSQVTYTVKVKGYDNNGQYIEDITTFKQNADGYTFALVPDSVTLGYDATSANFTVSAIGVSNIGFDSVNSQNALNTSTASSTAATAKFTANSSTANTKTVKFVISGETNGGTVVYATAMITLRKKPVEGSITPSGDISYLQNMTCDDTTVYTIRVTSNVSWTATTTYSWIHITNVTSAQFKVHLDENDGGDRSGTITLKPRTSGQADEYTINVSQLECDTPDCTLSLANGYSQDMFVNLSWEASDVMKVRFNTNLEASNFVFEPNAEWIHMSGGTEVQAGVREVSVWVDENTTRSSRDSYISIYSANDCVDAITMTVSQVAGGLVSSLLIEGVTSYTAPVNIAASGGSATYNFSYSNVTDIGTSFVLGAVSGATANTTTLKLTVGFIENSTQFPKSWGVTITGHTAYGDIIEADVLGTQDGAVVEEYFYWLPGRTTAITSNVLSTSGTTSRSYETNISNIRWTYSTVEDFTVNTGTSGVVNVQYPANTGSEKTFTITARKSLLGAALGTWTINQAGGSGPVVENVTVSLIDISITVLANQRYGALGAAAWIQTGSTYSQANWPSANILSGSTPNDGTGHEITAYSTSVSLTVPKGTTIYIFADGKGLTEAAYIKTDINSAEAILNVSTPQSSTVTLEPASPGYYYMRGSFVANRNTTISVSGNFTARG